MTVLVSDTSVIIDLERGELLESVFQLAVDFAVPDLLFHRELAGPLGDRLLALGELRGERAALALDDRQPRLGRGDPGF